MELGHELGCLDVCRVFGIELVLLVAGDEVEAADVFVKILQRENDGWRVALQKRQVRILFRLQIVQGDALEVGNDEEAGRFLFPP